MVAEISPELAEFLDKRMAVIVGTQRENGTIKLTTAWYDRRGGQIWMNSWRGSAWGRHIE